MRMIAEPEAGVMAAIKTPVTTIEGALEVLLQLSATFFRMVLKESSLKPGSPSATAEAAL